MNDPGSKAGATHAYVLGHSNHEMERLKSQARLIDPVTLQFFLDGGIEAGMRVLDVGSGAGDVSFLVAKLVGERGEVVGVDLVPEAIETARERAAALSLGNVEFQAGDPAGMPFDRPFDAVVGRYVLQFQRDPAAMLRKLATCVKPGGLVVFHEIDWRGLGSVPPVPSYDRCCQWGLETLRQHGTESSMGTKLYSTFVSAGLAPPTMRLESLVAGDPNHLEMLRLVADLVATLLPEMERLGVATAAEVDVPTLVERMRREAVATSSIVIGHSQVGAWSRV